MVCEFFDISIYCLVVYLSTEIIMCVQILYGLEKWLVPPQH